MPRLRRVGEGALQNDFDGRPGTPVGAGAPPWRPSVAWAAGDPPRRGCVDDDNKGPARVAVRREGDRERWKMAR